MRWLLIAFVVVPLTELYLLLWLSGIIGFWQTVLITVVTGVVGGTLAKREGLRVWRQWAEAFAAGRAPDVGVIEGLLVLLGGAFLLTPGVLTDVLGFVLLLPPTRRSVARFIRAEVDRRIASGAIRVVSTSVGGPAGPVDVRPRAPHAGPVIDTTGEARDAD